MDKVLHVKLLNKLNKKESVVTKKRWEEFSAKYTHARRRFIVIEEFEAIPSNPNEYTVPPEAIEAINNSKGEEE